MRWAWGVGIEQKQSNVDEVLIWASCCFGDLIANSPEVHFGGVPSIRWTLATLCIWAFT